ncbi:NUDIX domain-containing protein [Bosea psychrotolerans]|uniref:NUDIX domain-containing protein n=1 Tax=Bosea psychrotolerans TaxID=1871628 RepID=UPI000CDA5429|nr:NUDIX domain-containing protein [Bosea psychrotolerans]
MPKRSAGILMHRRANGELLVLLAHPGGPFWRGKDVGAWSIPKGGIEAGEQAEAAARREFAEETGFSPSGVLHPLGTIRQRSGKVVEAFALEGDFDIDQFRSAVVEIEWPPGRGRVQSFPEIDRLGWFAFPMAREKILPAQLPLLDRLEVLASA